MKRSHLEQSFEGSATVGERGQVVIPAGVRDRLGIKPGDKLLVFTHPDRGGVSFIKLQELQAMIDSLKPFVDSLEAQTTDEESVPQ